MFLQFKLIRTVHQTNCIIPLFAEDIMMINKSGGNSWLIDMKYHCFFLYLSVIHRKLLKVGIFRDYEIVVNRSGQSQVNIILIIPPKCQSKVNIIKPEWILWTILHCILELNKFWWYDLQEAKNPIEEWKLQSGVDSNPW